MRVIGGTYRGRVLRAPSGPAIRPTSDRLRETLFNILGPRIEGSRFLDLCAGSGAVGIEAISRGAADAVFIELSRRACAAIEANLTQLGIRSEATIVNRGAIAALERLAGDSRLFDLVFFDPPYAAQVYDQVVDQLGSGELLSPGAIVVVEHRARNPMKPRYGKLQKFRELKQGETALSMYDLAASVETPAIQR